MDRRMGLLSTINNCCVGIAWCCFWGKEMEKGNFSSFFFRLSVAHIEMVNYCSEWKDVAHYLLQYLTPPFIFLAQITEHK